MPCAPASLVGEGLYIATSSINANHGLDLTNVGSHAALRGWRGASNVTTIVPGLVRVGFVWAGASELLTTCWGGNSTPDFSRVNRFAAVMACDLVQPVLRTLEFVPSEITSSSLVDNLTISIFKTSASNATGVEASHALELDIDLSLQPGGQLPSLPITNHHHKPPSLDLPVLHSSREQIRMRLRVYVSFTKQS